MRLQFTKMHGAGNDFVLIDNRPNAYQLTREQIVRICDRHLGIGADGIILLVNCNSGKADWAWQFYNSDGTAGEMCGNGARCFARFVQKLTSVKQGFTFETQAGIISASFQDGRVTINLTEPTNLKLNQTLPLSSGPEQVHSLNTGVPHAVLFVPDADKAMVQQQGPEVRRHPHFGPKGTNVNFVQLIGPNRIRVRTFERGVEGETLACGTGVTASALIAARVHRFHSPVEVQVQSGEKLEVSFTENNGGFTRIYLSGPAEFVFDGEIEL